VVDNIVPMYRRLSADVELGLEVVIGSTAVLAIQRWRDRAALERALDGPAFASWCESYEPILAAWYEMVDFHDEWETTVLLP
jgi:hypothetical protein